MICTNTLYL